MIIEEKVQVKNIKEISIYFKGNGNPDEKHEITGIRIGNLLIGESKE